VVLTDNLAVLHALAAALLERETLSREELEMLSEGKELPPFRLAQPEPPIPEIPEPIPAAAKERVPSGSVELKPRLA
jgi:cell division protease FtsH